jgi:hypothetical protein
MPTRYDGPSYEFVGDAMRLPAVRAGLRAKAEALARRADALGASEGVKMASRVKDGTRPKGRPYSRIESDNVKQEWGSRDSERRRILGRVAEGG